MKKLFNINEKSKTITMNFADKDKLSTEDQFMIQMYLGAGYKLKQKNMAAAERMRNMAKQNNLNVKKSEILAFLEANGTAEDLEKFNSIKYFLAAKKWFLDKYKTEFEAYMD